MAMEFGDRFAKSTGEVAAKALMEGGGLAIGFIGSGIVGNIIETNVGTVGSKAVTSTSTITDKFVAWAMNNAPKVALYVAVKQFGPQGDPKNMTDLMIVDAKKAAIASLVVDSALRLSNGGVPGGTSIFGYKVMGNAKSLSPQSNDNMQKVLQENSSLRGQLNSAMQRLASAPSSTPVNVTATPIRQVSPQTAPQTAPQAVYATPPADHDRRFGMMASTAEAEDRRKNYGSMTPPIEAERNRNYSQMNKAKMNFAGEVDNAASAFGML